MGNKNNEYYYLDIELTTMMVVEWGEIDTANLTGNTSDPNVHRVYLTKGQFNKFKRKLA